MRGWRNKGFFFFCRKRSKKTFVLGWLVLPAWVVASAAQRLKKVFFTLIA
jgi:hypothetical protein